MRVETIRPAGPDRWVVGLVGLQTEKFRNVTLTASHLQQLRVRSLTHTFTGDGALLRLGLQAYSLGIAYEFDPYFGLSISRVDPLPHQLEAVYDYLLKLARVRFLLADDAGAGKTIMAGLLIRELKLRGLAERILIVCPGEPRLPVAAGTQGEVRREVPRPQGRATSATSSASTSGWSRNKSSRRSTWPSGRDPPGLRQVHWDLVIVDEAHRMSWPPPSAKSRRYALGELLRDTSDHLLLLTATPHKGDPVNFSLFLQLLDADAYADVRSIREAMERRRAPFYLRRTKEAMVYFPERQAGRHLGCREDLHQAHSAHGRLPDRRRRSSSSTASVTRFVKRQSAELPPQGDDPRARPSAS